MTKGEDCDLDATTDGALLFSDIRKYEFFGDVTFVAFLSHRRLTSGPNYTNYYKPPIIFHLFPIKSMDGSRVGIRGGVTRSQSDQASHTSANLLREMENWKAERMDIQQLNREKMNS